MFTHRFTVQEPNWNLRLIRNLFIIFIILVLIVAFLFIYDEIENKNLIRWFFFYFSHHSILRYSLLIPFIVGFLWIYLTSFTKFALTIGINKVELVSFNSKDINKIYNKEDIVRLEIQPVHFGRYSYTGQCQYYFFIRLKNGRFAMYRTLKDDFLKIASEAVANEYVFVEPRSEAVLLCKKLSRYIRIGYIVGAILFLLGWLIDHR